MNTPTAPDAPLTDEELAKLNERFAGYRVHAITDVMGGRLLSTITSLRSQLQEANAGIAVLVRRLENYSPHEDFVNSLPAAAQAHIKEVDGLRRKVRQLEVYIETADDTITNDIETLRVMRQRAEAAEAQCKEVYEIAANWSRKHAVAEARIKVLEANQRTAVDEVELATTLHEHILLVPNGTTIEDRSTYLAKILMRFYDISDRSEAAKVELTRIAQELDMGYGPPDRVTIGVAYLERWASIAEAWRSGLADEIRMHIPGRLSGKDEG